MAVLAAIVTVGAAPAPAAAASEGPGRARSHVVARGETLSAVAARFGVDLGALARLNGIADTNRVRAGDRLRIPARKASPGGGAPAPAPTPAAGGALPERLRRNPARLALMSHFETAARDFKVAPDLLKAVTWQESGWQNDKVSSTAALGIGQLMPATVRFVNDVLLRAKLDPRRPEHNIRMSARFLSYLLAQTKGDVAAAVASYYQGLASVRRHGPFAETRRYVDNVLALRQKF